MVAHEPGSFGHGRASAGIAKVSVWILTDVDPCEPQHVSTIDVDRCRHAPQAPASPRRVDGDPQRTAPSVATRWHGHFRDLKRELLLLGRHPR